MAKLTIDDLFSIEDQMYLDYLLDDDIEHGGDIKLNKIVVGDDDMGINLDPTAYNFHTHPRKFYRNEKTYSAYFSGIDIKYIIRNSMDKLKQHLLFLQDAKMK
eukprot:Pgem_evm3s20065